MISIGKSLLSHCEKYSPEAAAFARAYFQTVPFMLNEKNDYLTINYDNKDIIRDFSKTTRIGEIAQGINYFYFKNHMNVCSIYDYKIYANNYLNVKTSGQSPDYVLVYNSGQLGLMESKGTLQANPSEFILNGKKQCLNGKSCLSPYISNDYVSAVNFATSSKRMKRNSTIYIVDPPYNTDWKENDMEKHIKNEYSKWFHLLGMENEFYALKNNENISSNFFKPISKNYEIDILKSYEIFTPERHMIEIGIQPWAKEYLITGKNYNELQSYILENQTSNNNEEFFSDGMYIRFS
ncbi:MAG: hypothetical protein PHY47_22355 [Lachnospiraceae bacterium]|nr:hypothetical protein [Lachnospiraceae bacterium]